ncbi:chord-domain-containing protein [Viridothelium virens]|uniref:Chord-domain-containing protein n=1 Tax=Viridothelium virens TaxID=1048519 RepID=A0A6A6H9U0_VIRVR|nr:chord-domain-containing protein [Viridothelium virens]
MSKKCVHKGCGKKYEDDDEDCVYHPGPPEFHEGQKGWKCCKPRVLTFDEFLAIPPCTTGKHSTVDDTPQPEKPPQDESVAAKAVEPAIAAPAPRLAQPANAPPRATPSPAPPEDEDDDPSLPIPTGATCKRKACGVTYSGNAGREGEQCLHHPGVPIFHEGSKGYSCCKKRVLEFDEFLTLQGCKTKDKHLFVGSGKKGEETLDTVRHDFYQTSTTVIASLYLKKINKDSSKISFTDPTTIDLDLHTSDNKSYQTSMPLYAPIDTAKSKYKIMGTKVEFELAKADGSGWPVLRADERLTGEIIQTGRAGSV